MILPTDTLMIIAAPFIGSFLATLACRMPVGAPIILGRSACLTCKSSLTPLSMIPLISWLVQRGRCSHCHGRISATYPLTELSAVLMAIWAVWALASAPTWLQAATCLLGWSLLALSVIDLRHFILPDALTLPLAAAGLLVTFLLDPSQLQLHLAASLAGFGVMALLNCVYRKISGHDGLGLGDAKLLGAGGAWVGFSGLAGIVFIASIAALAWVLVQGAKGRRFSAQAPIAFGPFLSLGIWIVWLYGPLNFG